MKTTKVLSLMVFVLTALIGACQTDTNSAADTKYAAIQKETNDPQGKIWLLREIDGKKVGLSNIKLQFNAGQANGSNGCNQFGAPYQLDVSGKLQFNAQKYFTTRIACQGESGEIERVFTKVLEQTRFFSNDGNHLILRDGLVTAKGRVLAKYVAETTAKQTSKDDVQATKVTGSVKFPTAGIPLLTGTTAIIKLSDVSLMDISAIELSQQRVALNGTEDINYSLPYSADKIQQGFRYAVSARIEHNGKLLFINDSHIGVINNGKTSDVEIVLIAIPN